MSHAIVTPMSRVTSVTVTCDQVVTLVRVRAHSRARLRPTPTKTPTPALQSSENSSFFRTATCLKKDGFA